jgi:hypothetical protein
MAEVTKAELADFDKRLRSVERVGYIATAVGVIGLGVMTWVGSGIVSLTTTLGELREAKVQAAEYRTTDAAQRIAEVARIDRALDAINARLVRMDFPNRPIQQATYTVGTLTLLTGRIQKIDGDAITVALDIGTWACRIGPKTTVKVNDKPADSKKLAVGMDAQFVLANKSDTEPLLVDATTPQKIGDVPVRRPPG